MKSDFRLGRNFYKGVFGDAVNALLAAATYNFKRAMRLLWTLVEKISETLYWKNVSLEYIFLRRCVKRHTFFFFTHKAPTFTSWGFVIT